MDWNLIITVSGAVATIIGVFYGITRNFKHNFNKKFEMLEERIFQLAMGRSLKEILLKEKSKKKAKGE